MKKILFYAGCIAVINTSAQTSAQLDINNINATVNTIYQPLFHNSINSSAGFEAPRGSGLRTIFGSNLWVAAKDLNDSVYTAISSWGPGHDFIPGPIMDSLQYATQIPQWNRVWNIKRSDVVEFINFFNGQGQQGYQVPADFLSWPAHGDTTLGQAINLAPFFDNDNDGIYDPMMGDYPMVPGDQCIYFLFNDDTIHTVSGGKKMKIEVHAFVYSFNCPSDSALQNTVFVKYKIINRGANMYDTKFGIFTDTDLGGAIDDFLGCQVSNGSYYSYNGDNHDDPYSGVWGYGDSLASQSITFLAGPFVDSDGIDNPITTNISNAIDSLGIPYSGLGMNYGNGVVDDERLGLGGFTYFNSSSPQPTSYPGNANDYFNYMAGLWLDSTNMVYGGSGHITSPDAIANGLVPTTYLFPGDSDPLNWGTAGVPVPSPWTEYTAGNMPSDRHGMGWSGSFTFESGSVEELDIAYVFARDCFDTSNASAPVLLMNNRINDIRNYFESQLTPCNTFYTVASIEESSFEYSFELYPNPSSQQFTISTEILNSRFSYSIYNILGKEITSGKINSSQTSIDCSYWAKGVYLVRVGNDNEYAIKKVVVE